VAFGLENPHQEKDSLPDAKTIPKVEKTA